MLPELDYTDSEELGYYTTFKALFPDFYPYLKDQEKEHPIEVNFQFTDEDTPPNEAQIAGHTILQTRGNEMLHNLLTYLKQDEEYFMELYGFYRETVITETDIDGEEYTRVNKDGFPAVDHIGDYLNYFGIGSIIISESEEDGFAYIGFCGGCPWDSEHGFGAAFHKEQLLHVGSWDYGYHPSWGSPENEDDHFLTDSFTKLHLLESLSARKERLTKASQSIQLDDSTAHEEIFDWLLSHKMIYGYRNKPVDLTAGEKVVLLREITSLEFYWNLITEVPESIILLEQLTNLTLSSNTLGAVPLPFLKLSKLETLTINNNRLTKIPLEIGLVPNLKTLNLKWNQLKTLPAEIGALSNLNMLDLSSNALTDLPESIAKLSKLEYLE
ncbi:MAG: leucine-rich repeat domain-containing protein, partial [Bacteroidota bacterium]